MRIIVCETPSPSATSTAEVARLLADRLGDSVQFVRGSGPDDSPRSPVAETSGPEPGPLTLTAETVATACAIEPHPLNNHHGENARLAVVSCGPATGHRSWIRPSPAEEIALTIPVPTLVVRDAAPLTEWMHGHRRLRVLCAHGLSRTGDGALAFVKQFAEAGDCELVVMHAFRPLEDGAKLGLHPDPGGEGEVAVRRILQRELEERGRRILGPTPFEVRLYSSSLDRAHAVLELLKSEPFDLVVAGTHQRHGPDRLSHPVSLSRALLRSAPTNVLLVPQALSVQPLPGGAISRVLVATDLSWESNQAVAPGYAMLSRGGVLRLLHVVHPRALPDGEFDQGLSRRTHLAQHLSVLSESRTRLQSLALNEEAAPGVTTEFEIVEHAQPAIAIAQAAERFGADVVCLAAHRPDGIFGRLFKTEIDEVMAKSHRPLLIVHPSPP